jgi:hypothetical protein
MNREDLPKFVLSRSGKARGKPTGAFYKCALESCTGTRVTVRWPDGRITRPCSRGMKFLEGNGAQIL